MNDQQREVIKRIRENGKRQRQFLSGERLHRVVDMFKLKKSGDKAIIPIGLQPLKIKSVKETTARNGKPLGIVEFYKAPDNVWYKNAKQSYKPIRCYHMLQDISSEDPMHWYFRGFTSEISKDGFQKIKKLQGNIVYAVVMQTKKFLKQYGMVQVDNLGDPIVYYESSIIEVYDEDCDLDNIKINYWNLYDI